ncbi:MATE family efflux transporter [Streptococcus sp. X16XC17]|uniref:MATE family efflux transporter n=1 Tax=unclassified Streptococcus TaxID=2608887 RepID=UPI00066FD532|nr:MULTISPECIES: MATE family efflux transporter [unclassified Streptococcus]TCD45904.1 MATE family efflux transporter [Streptococcus sp. X16XC17]
MTETKKILGLALPAMAENFLQMLMSMVDSYLIAFLGISTLSGVSVAGNILSIYQALFIALGAAVSSVIAKYLGQGNQAEVAKQSSQALLLTTILSLFLGMLSLFGGNSMLALLGTETVVARIGGLYLAWVGGASLFLGLMTTLGSILRASGRTQVPMYVGLLSNALNLALSALFVFILQWGVAGVALGTVIARAVGALILWKLLPFKLPRLTKKWELDLFHIAFSAAGERLMMRAGDVVIVALIVSLGTAAVAGNSIGETLTQFNYMPGLGFATATVILVANARGAGDLLAVKSIIKRSFLLSLTFMLLISGILFSFGQSLTYLYTDHSDAVAASLIVLLASFVGTPATAGTLIYTAAWQGAGNARLPFYATTIGMWCIRIGVGYVLTQMLDFGVAGVWIATILDNIFRWFFLYFMFLKQFKVSLS